jgi:hypothetical protein
MAMFITGSTMMLRWTAAETPQSPLFTSFHISTDRRLKDGLLDGKWKRETARKRT